MRNLNDEGNPDGAPDDFEFAQKLRLEPLGGGPVRRDRVLYECGYAAGLAAGTKKLRANKILWQSATIEATLLGCLSLVTHFYPVRSTANHVGFVRSETIAPRQSNPLAESMTAFGDNPDHQRTESIWRPTTRVSDFQFAPVISVGSPQAPSSAERPLRPGDTQNFLNGGV